MSNIEIDFMIYVPSLDDCERLKDIWRNEK